MFNKATWYAGEGSEISGEWVLPAPVEALRSYDVLAELPVGMSTALARDCAITRLMNLRFETSSGDFVERDGEPDEEGIRGFVDRYGLLGILHQDVIEIYGVENGWRREHGRWTAASPHEPGAVLDITPFRHKSSHTGIERLNSNYFPAGLPSEHLPSPTSSAFFTVYAEKVEDWWEMALHLGNAIRDGNRKMLEIWLSVAGFGLTDEPEPLDYKSSFPSLFSALIAQYVNAVRDGLHLRICKNEACPRVKVFFGVQRARFCSPYCANAQHQRDRRNKGIEELYLKMERQRKLLDPKLEEARKLLDPKLEGARKLLDPELERARRLVPLDTETAQIPPDLRGKSARKPKKKGGI